jgi:hypothetical protein
MEFDEEEEAYVNELQYVAEAHFDAQLMIFLVGLGMWADMDMLSASLMFELANEALGDAPTGMQFVDDAAQVLMQVGGTSAAKGDEMTVQLGVPWGLPPQTKDYIEQWVEKQVGNLIVDIDAYTHLRVKDLIDEGIREGWNVRQMEKGLTELYSGFTESTKDRQGRAERIARTEAANARNFGTLAGYMSNGVKYVLVSDGIDDPPCEEANGSIWTVAHSFDNLISHPNCTRGFSPFTGSLDEQAYKVSRAEEGDFGLFEQRITTKQDREVPLQFFKQGQPTAQGTHVMGTTLDDLPDAHLKNMTHFELLPGEYKPGATLGRHHWSEDQKQGFITLNAGLLNDPSKAHRAAQVVRHEVGHHANSILIDAGGGRPTESDRFMSLWERVQSGEIEAPTTYARNNPDELFAESYALLTTQGAHKGNRPAGIDDEIADFFLEEIFK